MLFVIALNNVIPLFGYPFNKENLFMIISTFYTNKHLLLITSLQ